MYIIKNGFAYFYKIWTMWKKKFRLICIVFVCAIEMYTNHLWKKYIYHKLPLNKISQFYISHQTNSSNKSEQINKTNFFFSFFFPYTFFPQYTPSPFLFSFFFPFFPTTQVPPSLSFYFSPTTYIHPPSLHPFHFFTIISS